MSSNPRESIIGLLGQVGIYYTRATKLYGFELHHQRDVHAFYHLIQRSPLTTLHIQGYPGMSNDEKVYVRARLLDRNHMDTLRRLATSVGNEHAAVITSAPIVEEVMPAHLKKLKFILEQNFPDLK